MADLGNRNAHLRLQCKTCGWPAPDDMPVRDSQLHFQVEHDTDEVKFDLVPVCVCGEAMTITNSSPTGGGIRDWLLCGVCGNTGYVRREPDG